MTDANTLNLLGLARRGGRLALGEEPVAEVCQSKKARVVFLAADAGDTTARRGTRMAESAGIPLVILPWSKSEIGAGLGRASCALLALTDQGLASAVVERLAREDESLRELADAMSAKTKRHMERREKKKQTARAAKKPADH